MEIRCRKAACSCKRETGRAFPSPRQLDCWMISEVALLFLQEEQASEPLIESNQTTKITSRNVTHGPGSICDRSDFRMTALPVSPSVRCHRASRALAKTRSTDLDGLASGLLAHHVFCCPDSHVLSFFSSFSVHHENMSSISSICVHSLSLPPIASASPDLVINVTRLMSREWPWRAQKQLPLRLRTVRPHDVRSCAFAKREKSAERQIRSTRTRFVGKSISSNSGLKESCIRRYISGI